MKMYTNTKLLVVGGTGRNVGKTEFVCRLIAKIASHHSVYALKVSSIFPDEEIYHGTHSEGEARQQLFEETRANTKKDTSRMLRAGAKKVFYLQGNDSEVEAGYELFLAHVPENTVIVCESNSLGQFVRPALSVMVKSRHGAVKPRAVSQLDCADLVVVSDGGSGFSELEFISYSEDTGWLLQPITVKTTAPGLDNT